jgi:hypothetical protein
MGVYQASNGGGSIMATKRVINCTVIGYSKNIFWIKKFMKASNNLVLGIINRQSCKPLTITNVGSASGLWGLVVDLAGSEMVMR